MTAQKEPVPGGFETASNLVSGAAGYDVAAPIGWFDGESAAWLSSLLMHLTVVVALGLLSVAGPQRNAFMDLSLSPISEIEPEPLPTQFFSSDASMHNLGALSSGGEGAALALAPQLSEQPLVSAVEMLSDVSESPAFESEADAAHAPELTDALVVQGTGSVGVTGADGAIDRLTHEILASLEQRPTLVVWLFDQSGSLRDERGAILARFRRIYDELGVIEAADNPAFRRHRDKPLLTAVVGFGAAPRMLTREPTDRLEQIEAAISSIEDDATGQENVFTAIGRAAEKFHAYQSRSRGERRVMIVVFTDESGDDLSLVDNATDVCRRFGMPVYVVGRPAPFGRETAYVKWIDPDPRYDQRPQWVPVSLGPESLMPEALKLRFAGSDDGELLDSGFGPYALTRLCYETGGLYFATHPNRVVGRRVTGDETKNLAAHFATFFDADAMRPYQPNYVSSAEYVSRIRGNRARRALVEAAAMTWASQLEDVRLRFPRRDEAELASLLSEAQQAAALVQPKLDALCETLLSGEADRPRELEPRWQAGYDLALGRALAAKVRADGYNTMLAKAKQGAAFRDQRNNTWILRPDNQFAATSLETLAAKAIGALERLQRDHPGTPWAALADRELRTPLGWQWDEGYSYLPPRDAADGGERPRRAPQREPQGPPRRDPPPL